MKTSPNDIREKANRAKGLPCYCGSLADGRCDMCTGLAPVGGERWNGQLAEQAELVTILIGLDRQ